MEAVNLIKKQLAFLKEKELHEGLTQNEKVELGKLYITDELNETYEQIAIIKKKNYWKERCMLAEGCLKLLYVTGKQTNEHKEASKNYNNFIFNEKEPK